MVVTQEIQADRCPICGMRLRIYLPPGQVAKAFCRSKLCRGQWVTVDKRNMV